MAIDALSGLKAYQQVARAQQSAAGIEAGDSLDFGNMVQNAMSDAANAARTAEQAGMAAATGRADIVDVVTAIAAAEASLETVIAVRDQVIQSYQEIMRMPI
jgi:flagellar hook-basal body complex protein FliE